MDVPSVSGPLACGLRDVAVELLVFSGKTRRRTPMSPVDGRPIRRASLSDVRALVGDGERVAY